MLLTFDTPLQGFLPQTVSFLTYFDCIVPQSSPEDFFYHQDGQKRLHVHVVEEPLKPPAYSLTRDSEGFVNLFPVSAFEHHVAGMATLQFHLEIFRIFQFAQILQKLGILLC